VVEPSSFLTETTHMSVVNRRLSLKLLLGGLLQTAGTVVLASAVLPVRAAGSKTGGAREGSAKDLRQRADQVADAQGPVAEEQGHELCEFANGGFRNAAFANHSGGSGGSSGGAFRNGGFTNGGGGGGAFRNGGFANGGWRN